MRENRGVSTWFPRRCGSDMNCVTDGCGDAFLSGGDTPVSTALQYKFSHLGPHWPSYLFSTYTQVFGLPGLSVKRRVVAGANLPTFVGKGERCECCHVHTLASGLTECSGIYLQDRRALWSRSFGGDGLFECLGLL